MCRTSRTGQSRQSVSCWERSFLFENCGGIGRARTCGTESSGQARRVDAGDIRPRAGRDTARRGGQLHQQAAGQKRGELVLRQHRSRHGVEHKVIGKTAGIAASFVGFQPERLSHGAVGRPARRDGHAGGKAVQLVCQHAADVPVADDKAGRAVQPVRAVQHGKGDGALGCRHGVVRCQRLRAEKLDRLRAAVEQGLPQRAEPAAIDPRTVAAAGEHGGMTIETVKRHDAEHLILGTRLHDWSKYNRRVVEACARYCDLVSINYYARWQPETDFLANLKAWCGTKPFLVSEFYTKAEDATYKGIKYANVEGGGWLVRTQKNRGEFYQNFCLRLLEARNCVGWVHFEYNDGYDSDGKASNKGIVSIEYEPYKSFLLPMRQLNLAVYSLIDYYDKE